MTPAQLLAFEAANPRGGPDKNMRIRQQLSITEVRYAVLLARAAVSVEGIAADPVTARMVRERAEARTRERGRRTAA